MMPGPILIKKCSACGGLIEEEILMSGNTCGAVYWTDGEHYAPMLPDTPELVKCPHCKETIASLQVLRLVRTRVNFISMLPRRGHVVACPACHQILSAELGGGLSRAV